MVSKEIATLSWQLQCIMPYIYNSVHVCSRHIYSRWAVLSPLHRKQGPEDSRYEHKHTCNKYTSRHPCCMLIEDITATMRKDTELQMLHTHNKRISADQRYTET